MKILIVEDEQHLAEGLRFNLEAEGFEAEVAEDGQSALDVLRANRYDAVVLDVMLPHKDGFEVAAEMRSRGDHTPVLMLTALGRPEDVLKGFEAGTDDYLAKPFDLAIFIARVRALVRRRQWAATEAGTPPADAIYTVNGRTIDLDNLELRHGDAVIRLTLMESRLLGYLISQEGRAVSRAQILTDVWQLNVDTDTRAIDNFIVRLRRHIEDDPADPQILQTVRGVGYRFVAEACTG
ncbi:MAG: response regulator transcription factor [Chloracidobacterium sp.]|nr:response regulator transcription factor [Chloracidobacterium sp.]